MYQYHSEYIYFKFNTSQQYFNLNVFKKIICHLTVEILLNNFRQGCYRCSRRLYVENMWILKITNFVRSDWLIQHSVFP